MYIHSPEQEIILPLFKQKSIRLSIKRDDLIHPFISGNKWRKLKYNLKKAQELRKTTLVTFGGAWSNHLLATACAAATQGFKSIGFVRGDIINNPVLTMCKLFGMNLHFVDRTSYKNKIELYNSLDRIEETFFIDEGGAGLEASLGCAELIDELETVYDYIVCAAGTGTTAAGLATGIATKQLKTELLVVPVLKGGDFILEEMQKLQVPTNQTKLLTSYHFGGYAKTQPALIDFITYFVQATGILIEPTYTGKSLYALYDLVAKDFFPPNSKILFIHTGGLTGILGMVNKFE